MFKHLFVIALTTLSSVSHVNGAEQGTHLFILSGQSNMARLDPNESFTPAVMKEFGKNNVIVVKDAKGGQPIRRWYKKWKPASGEASEAAGQSGAPTRPAVLGQRVYATHLGGSICRCHRPIGL